MRKELRAWLRRLHDEVHVTSIFVTHDQEEAMEVADEIVVMNNGKIEQVGTPADIYDHPATPFVMNFIGQVNVLSSSAKLFQENGIQPQQKEVFIRPHDLELYTTANGVKATAIVKRIIHLGWDIQVELGCDETEVLVAHLSREQFAKMNLEPGQQVFVKPKKAIYFPENLMVS